MACRRARAGLKSYADQTGNYPREPETLGCASAGVLRTHHQAVDLWAPFTKSRCAAPIRRQTALVSPHVVIYKVINGGQ